MFMRAKQVGSDPSVDALDRQAAADALSPSSRVLLAVETIAKHGPMTYEALRVALGMSKTATWRLVETLKQSGWVRLRQGGREIELDHRLDDLFATAHFADPEFALVADAMCAVAESRAVHLDLFVVNSKGELDLHETTRRITSAAQPIDTQDETVWLAVRGAMSRPQLERHLQQVAETIAPEALRQIRSTMQRHRAGNAPGYHFATEGRFLVVSVRGAMGTAAALRFSPRAPNLPVEELMAAFEDMRLRTSDYVASLAGIAGDA